MSSAHKQKGIFNKPWQGRLAGNGNESLFVDFTRDQVDPYWSTSQKFRRSAMRRMAAQIERTYLDKNGLGKAATSHSSAGAMLWVALEVYRTYKLAHSVTTHCSATGEVQGYNTHVWGVMG